MMDSLASQAITDAPDRGEMSFRRELEIIQEEVKELWHEEEQEKKEILGCGHYFRWVDGMLKKCDVDDLVGKWNVEAVDIICDVDDVVGKFIEFVNYYCNESCESMSSRLSFRFVTLTFLSPYILKCKMVYLVGKLQTRCETGGKASKARDDGSMDGFSFLAERKELPKTDTKKSPKHLWLLYSQFDSPGESKTLLSKPLYDERSETENFINYSSKLVDHCTSAKKDTAIVPDNDRLLCKVCYMNELSIVFLPCSHMVACRRCAARLKTCPVCRSGIKEALPANLHE